MASDPSNPLADIDVWNTPSMAPPPGVIPNFIDPPSKSPMVRAGLFTILPLMIIVVALRVYTRIRITRAFGADDYLCLAATACIVTFSALILSFLDKPAGRHMWDIPLGELLYNHYWVEALYGSVMVYCVGNMFTKLALLMLYLRIFKPAVWARWSILLGIGLTVAFYLATFIASFAICVDAGRPIWQSFQDDKCANDILIVVKVQAWYGVFSDFYILAIPLWLVWGLHMSPKRKFGVLAIFLTGLAACAVSIASLVQRYTMLEQGEDRTWTNCDSWLYTVIELGIGVICSCMPVTTVVLKSVATSLNSVWSSLTGHSHNQHSGATDEPDRSGQLPAIPRGNLSGVRTFIRRLNRTKGEATTINLATFESINSVDQPVDYHAQLKQIQVQRTYDIESQKRDSTRES